MSYYILLYYWYFPRIWFKTNIGWAKWSSNITKSLNKNQYYDFNIELAQKAYNNNISSKAYAKALVNYYNDFIGNNPNN